MFRIYFCKIFGPAASSDFFSQGRHGRRTWRAASSGHACTAAVVAAAAAYPLGCLAVTVAAAAVAVRSACIGVENTE